MPALQHGGDTAVEIGANGAEHALQRLWGPVQGGGALREHRPTAGPIAELPPESPTAESPPESPIWE